VIANQGYAKEEFSLVTYPGFTPVGNATLVVANVLTCNKHSQKNVRFKCVCRGGGGVCGAQRRGAGSEMTEDTALCVQGRRRQLLVPALAWRRCAGHTELVLQGGTGGRRV
jgi:hypothetical protein